MSVAFSVPGALCGAGASVRDLQLVTLIKIYRLLWVAVVLLPGIILPGIREYMFILAGVLLFDLFWRIWATRKVGQE